MPRKVHKRANNARGQRVKEAAAERLARGIAAAVFAIGDGLPRQTIGDEALDALYARHGGYDRFDSGERRGVPRLAIVPPVEWRGGGESMR